MLRTFAIAILLATVVQAQDRVPVVVELFTSEGCSSCPPADNLLAELDGRQPIPNVDVIVLSEHVDYWNSLGWKDPFSAALFSSRQQSYADMMHSSEIYTPEAVIDGRIAAVGSNRNSVVKAIGMAAEAPKAPLKINVHREGNTLTVEVPGAAHGSIWVAVAEAKRTSRVEHGENSGRTLQHVGVVRLLTRLTDNQARFAIDKSWTSDLRVVAFVQDQNSGRITQATQTRL